MRNNTTQQICSALHKTFSAAKFTVQYNGQRISWTDDGPTIEQVHQVILLAGCATEGESWDGKPILKLEDGRWICFSRYNIAERAAEQADLARRQEEYEARRNQREEAKQKADAEDKKFWSNLWSPQPIAPQPALAALRAFVLSRSEKRSPKWKFRIAANLVTEIQAKLLATGVERFTCCALMTANATAKMLADHKAISRGTEYYRLNYEIRAETPNEWFLKVTNTSRSHGAPENGYVRLHDRLVTMMQTSCFGEANSLTKLLTAHCICCGKGLTDPVSMARTIGPECYGSASVNLPFTFKLETDLPAGQ
jgi:hypothetical protein